MIGSQSRHAETATCAGMHTRGGVWQAAWRRERPGVLAPCAQAREGHITKQANIQGLPSQAGVGTQWRTHAIDIVNQGCICARTRGERDVRTASSLHSQHSRQLDEVCDSPQHFLRRTSSWAGALHQHRYFKKGIIAELTCVCDVAVLLLDGLEQVDCYLQALVARASKFLFVPARHDHKSAKT